MTGITFGLSAAMYTLPVTPAVLPCFLFLGYFLFLRSLSTCITDLRFLARPPDAARPKEEDRG